MLYKDSLLAQVSFPIMPLQYLQGKPVASHEISFLHSGLTYPATFADSYSKFLPNASEKRILKEQAQANSQSQGPGLLQWIDDLVNMFYSVERMCADSSSQVSVCGNLMNDCRTTQWSSLAPDPKSAIGEVNATSGMFDIWWILFDNVHDTLTAVINLGLNWLRLCRFD